MSSRASPPLVARLAGARPTLTDRLRISARRDQAVAGYECAILTGIEGLRALEGEWKALHAASKDRYLSQGFDWALLCANRMAHQDQARLRCFVFRAHGRTVALLPVAVSRTGAWRVGRPLASPTNEYCPLLFDPAADVARVWCALRAAQAGRRDLDAILLTHVRGDSALGAWLGDCPAATWISSLPAPFVRTSEFADWENYRASLPHKVQSNLGRNWKRIQRLGEVKVEEMTDPAEAQAAWRWMILHKRRWLDRKGLASPWIPSDDYFRFIGATLELNGHAGRRRIFALKLNGQIIAAELVNVDGRRVEMFVVTYDPSFAHVAPGNLLRGEILRWAFAQGLDYDMRVGGDAYKSEWANRRCDVATYVVALNVRGRSFSSYLAVRQWIANRTPEVMRARVRSLLRLPARHRDPSEPPSAAEDHHRNA